MATGQPAGSLAGAAAKVTAAAPRLQLPLTVTLDDFNNVEKVGELSKPLIMTVSPPATPCASG